MSLPISEKPEQRQGKGRLMYLVCIERHRDGVQPWVTVTVTGRIDPLEPPRFNGLTSARGGAMYEACEVLWDQDKSDRARELMRLGAAGSPGRTVFGRLVGTGKVTPLRDQFVGSLFYYQRGSRS